MVCIYSYMLSSPFLSATDGASITTQKQLPKIQSFVVVHRSQSHVSRLCSVISKTELMSDRLQWVGSLDSFLFLCEDHSALGYRDHK